MGFAKQYTLVDGIKERRKRRHRNFSRLYRLYSVHEPSCIYSIWTYLSKAGVQGKESKSIL